MNRHLVTFLLPPLASLLLAAVPAVANDYGDAGEASTYGYPVANAVSQSLHAKLVFTEDSSRDVYIMDWPGSTPVRLTNDDAGEWGLRWSPFGSKIAYLSSDGIWAMSPDGSGRYQLSDLTDYAFRLEWAPDASQIAFSRSPSDCLKEEALCSSEVWVIKADGSDLRKLAGSDSLHAWGPAWSPDGSQIAFVRGDIDCSTDCASDIWVTNADGSNQRNLGSPDRSESGARWSPDGSRIAFSSRSSANVDLIYVMNSDGSDRVRLTPDGSNGINGINLEWSPDGSKIAFETGQADLGCVDCPSDLGVIDLNGSWYGSWRILTNDLANISGPTWTPDGLVISFLATRGVGSDVWLVDPDGDNLYQATAQGSITSFAWEPPDRGRFGDVGTSSIFHNDVAWLAETAITNGCNPPANTVFCPDDYVTRGQMAAFLVRALGYTDDGGGNLFVDDDGSIFEDAIDKLGTAGVTKGCNPPTNDMFCPTANVTRGQMATFLVRALGYTDDGDGNLFDDDDDSIFEASIDKLATAGVTRGCNPPANDQFCPHNNVTRGEMAAFLHRALG